MYLEKIDLLKLMSEGKVTDDEAYKILQLTVDSQHVTNWMEHLGFSVAEATAHFHDVPLSVMVEWRKDGWPSTCPVCRKALKAQKGFWIDELNKSEISLIHTYCIQKNRTALKTVFELVERTLNHPLNIDEVIDVNEFELAYGSNELINYASLQFKQFN